jgi:two-component system sensor histidine kinase KdpD
VVVEMRGKPSHQVAFVVAIVAVLAAWGLRVLLAPWLGERLPFVSFLPMLFVLAWWGGLWPTLYATLLSALVLSYAILEPIGSFYISHPEYRVGLGEFVAIGIPTGF